MIPSTSRNIETYAPSHSNFDRALAKRANRSPLKGVAAVQSEMPKSYIHDLNSQKRRIDGCRERFNLLQA